ncbi:MAG: hypothetical protein IJF07_00880 [Lachnospiraceae bacterium]|nr:hypothetical protein [Lachnospiraceae bacterium]
MNKEELGRMHKEKCKELKKIRAQIAEELGVDLQQRECTYEGYCSGTCPKCKSEEIKLNMAIMKKQLEEKDIKRKVTAAGITTMAALSLTGCTPLTEAVNEVMESINGSQTQGMITPDFGESTSEPAKDTEEVLTGEVASTEEFEGGLEFVEELEGDVVFIEE